jgi:hypothetical protein
MDCRRCGSAQPEQARFCGRCGSPLGDKSGEGEGIAQGQLPSAPPETPLESSPAGGLQRRGQRIAAVGAGVVVLAALILAGWREHWPAGVFGPTQTASAAARQSPKQAKPKLSLPASDTEYLVRHLNSPVQTVQAKALVSPLRSSYLRHQPMFRPGVTVHFEPGTFHYYDLLDQRIVLGSAKVAVVTAIDSRRTDYLVTIFRVGMGSHSRWLIGNAVQVNP